MPVFEKRVEAGARVLRERLFPGVDLPLGDSAWAGHAREVLLAADAVVTERDAAVAATGRFECDRNCVGMNEPIEDCSAHGRTPRDLWDQIEKVAAERDAALAAIERVRAMVEEMGEAVGFDRLTHGCEAEYPVSYLRDKIEAALDGAPEPEWEYGLQDADGYVSFRNLSLKSLRKRAKQTEEMIVRRRKAGPWLPVEGESKS